MGLFQHRDNQGMIASFTTTFSQHDTPPIRLHLLSPLYYTIAPLNATNVLEFTFSISSWQRQYDGDDFGLLGRRRWWAFMGILGQDDSWHEFFHSIFSFDTMNEVITDLVMALGIAILVDDMHRWFARGIRIALWPIKVKLSLVSMQNSCYWEGMREYNAGC